MNSIDFAKTFELPAVLFFDSYFPVGFTRVVKLSVPMVDKLEQNGYLVFAFKKTIAKTASKDDLLSNAVLVKFVNRVLPIDKVSASSISINEHEKSSYALIQVIGEVTIQDFNIATYIASVNLVTTLQGDAQETQHKKELVELLDKYFEKSKMSPELVSHVYSLSSYYHVLNIGMGLCINTRMLSSSQLTQYISTLDLSERAEIVINGMNKAYYALNSLPKPGGAGGAGTPPGQNQTDVTKYRAFIDTVQGMPDDVKAEITAKIDQLERMSGQSSDKANTLSYLEVVMSIPWGIFTKTETDLTVIQKNLDESQYGMTEAKNRVVEQIALSLSRPGGFKGMVLCLIGQPGVGKTLFAKNVAKVLNRKATAIAMGGMNDVTILRGQRRGWVGSEAGQLVKALVKAKSMNPIIILDEIDKISGGHGEQVKAALLEILDPNQNSEYKDAYLDFPIDLSGVTFIATANYYEGIPHALRDRLEMIEIEPYSFAQKLEILKRFIIPKTLADSGISAAELEIKDEVLNDVIETYKREAGLRTSEQEVARMVRKFIVKKLDGSIIVSAGQPYVISLENMDDFLSLDKFVENFDPSTSVVGQINILAAGAAAGLRTSLQISIVPGTGKISTTGSLSKLSQEVVTVALSYFKSQREKYQIPEDYFETHDFMFHRTQMALEKDGPSSGVATAVCLYSAIKNIPIPQAYGVTGEVDLSGNAHAIGGVKQKLGESVLQGLTHFVLPSENKPDYEQLDQDVKDKIKVFFVDKVDEAIDIFMPGNLEKKNNEMSPLGGVVSPEIT